MEEAKITLKGKLLRNFPELKEQFRELGFTYVSSSKSGLELKKVETSDLKDKPQNVYRATFFKDRMVFSYSLGADKLKREFEALMLLLSLIRMCEGIYLIEAGELRSPLNRALSEGRALLESESRAPARQLAELQAKQHSMEKKYRELVLSNEQNARILLECEKKRNEYHSRIKQLEGMSDETLALEIFKWLKTHSGEINVAAFSKSYNIPVSRIEEGLETLLKKGYIKK